MRSDAPTLDDARLAADALVEAGAREVWLYGSVARGETRRGSDIDLVAVFDDLEYRRRIGITVELQRIAEEACGHRVEVMATDRPEWRIQREEVHASFVSAISCDLKLLKCSSSPPGEVCWDKEQVMATSDDELALERLTATLTNLDKITASLEPGRAERDLADSDDRLEYERVRAGRLIVMCEASHLAVENAAKTLAVLGGVKAQTLWSHDVAEIVGSLDDESSQAVSALLNAAPELVKHEGYITMWRSCGAYGTPTEGMTAQEVATPAFAAALALIACDAADYVARSAVEDLGRQDVIDSLLKWSGRLRDHLRGYDVGTGEPTA